VSAVDGSLERALAFERQTVALLADEVAPIDEGWLIRTPSLPQVWSLNEVRVTRPIRFGDALALVEAHMGELPYRQLVVEHPDAGRRLEAEFRAEGWQVDRQVSMALHGNPDRQVDTSTVIEPGEHETLELMQRWMGDAHQEATPEGLRQVLEYTRLTWRARCMRRLGMVGESGALAAMTMLYSDGTIAQVEDVYTVPEERGRGFARSLVTRAISLAREHGHELTFIVADDEGWPKHLYGRLGFQPVGRTWLFHRKVGD